jgi:hypothetical protein
VLAAAPWHFAIPVAAIPEKRQALRLLERFGASGAGGISSLALTGAPGARSAMEFPKLGFSASASPRVNRMASQSGLGVRLRYSPRRRFESLLLPRLGGGLDVSSQRLTRVARCAADPATLALAEERLLTTTHRSPVR